MGIEKLKQIYDSGNTGEQRLLDEIIDLILKSFYSVRLQFVMDQIEENDDSEQQCRELSREMMRKQEALAEFEGILCDLDELDEPEDFDLIRERVGIWKREHNQLEVPK